MKISLKMKKETLSKIDYYNGENKELIAGQIGGEILLYAMKQSLMHEFDLMDLEQIFYQLKENRLTNIYLDAYDFTMTDGVVTSSSLRKQIVALHQAGKLLKVGEQGRYFVMPDAKNKPEGYETLIWMEADILLQQYRMAHAEEKKEVLGGRQKRLDIHS